MTRRAVWAALAAAALLSLTPGLASAQLLSPGKLARAHEEIEGLRNCTSCHQLGRSGVSAERCLECHQAVATRIQSGSGYHASVPADSCATCHQDHLGADFALVRLDEGAFDHSETGYVLELSHGEVDCRGCHEPSHIQDPLGLTVKDGAGALERTFLGLATTCTSCHEADSPHGSQFAPRGCDDCHDSGQWETPPLFDHRSTAFPLEGLHAQVGCSECHGTGAEARYRPLPSESCSGCHSDPHGGAMAGACAGCHSTAGWHELGTQALGSSFDHSRTSFALRGAHGVADCAACHRTGRPPRSELVSMAYRRGTESRSFPLPVADTCRSCHVDRHAATGPAARWVDCASCHGEARWSPTAFGVVRHEDSDFPLTGAHAATPCVGCHVGDTPGGTFSLAVQGESCADCHAVDDPHEERYAQFTCEACHSTEAFEEAGFDHAVLPDAAQSCAGCHASDDPHAGQFEGSDCSSCHATEAFTVDGFDHGSTQFPLDGAHDGAECAACHTTEGSGDRAFVRYRPLGTECTDCHGADL